MNHTKRTRRLIALLPALQAVFVLAACGQEPAPEPNPPATDPLLRDVQVLSADNLNGRLVGTPGNRIAREYIVNRLESLGLDTLFLSPFQVQPAGGEADTVVGVNIIGMVRGSAPERGTIVVTAHYDHLGVRNGQIYNGADDNASGTAALIALAGVFAKQRPEHTLIFAAVDGEEGGLRGARAFVESPPIPLEQIVLNINFDMISRNDRNELYACGTFHYPRLKPPIEQTPLPDGLIVKFGHDNRERDGAQDWTTQSDHFAFHEKGIPFLYFGVEDHRDYHQPTDDFERIQPEFYKNVVSFLSDVVGSVDTYMASRADSAETRE